MMDFNAEQLFSAGKDIYIGLIHLKKYDGEL